MRRNRIYTDRVGQNKRKCRTNVERFGLFSVCLKVC